MIGRKINYILALIFILVTQMFRAQNSEGVSISTTVSEPDQSAMLDMQHLHKGFLLPRMTSTQKMAIVNPAEGLLIFQTNEESGFYFYNGIEWECMSCCCPFDQYSWSYPNFNNACVGAAAEMDDRLKFRKENGIVYFEGKFVVLCNTFQGQSYVNAIVLPSTFNKASGTNVTYDLVLQGSTDITSTGNLNLFPIVSGISLPACAIGTVFYIEGHYTAAN